MSKKNKPHHKPRNQDQKGTHGKPNQVVDASSKSAPATPPTMSPVVTPAMSPVISIDPLAPVIVRSGRPFDDQTGADSARFPPPSTLAGCLRTAWARQTGKPFGPELLNLTVAGPLLIRTDPDKSLDLLVPKPADALYFGSGTEARCVRAEPKLFDEGSGSDLPKGLLPVQLTTKEKEKPGKGPAWWTWNDLLAFREGQTLTHNQLSDNGWSPELGDRRTHVAIDRDTQSAKSGQLFQTEGLDLDPTNPFLKSEPCHTLRFLMRFAEPLTSGLVHLGGERRLAELRPEAEAVWPQIPENWFEQIIQAGGLSLTLLTPAVFSAGYRPGWLDDKLEGSPPPTPGMSSSPDVRLHLMAVAVDRWQPHSGWDLQHWKPRATRKLVAAGATYWFTIIGKPNADDLAKLWLASLCDGEQDRRNGFGLALPAAWKPVTRHSPETKNPE